jgi:low affinity Fe/Cu permease
MELERKFSAFANRVANATGRPWVFVLCLFMVAFWAVMGPVVGFSDTWQLVINTTTTILTFLQVFLIQNTQNRDNAALQVKLDELLRAARKKTFIGIEDLTDLELQELKEREGVAKPSAAKQSLKKRKR